MNNLISVKNVSMNFKESQVLNDINVDFEKGKIHGIIGRNGSGKTVLIKIICGLIKPTNGEVIVDGAKIGVEIDFPRSIGVIIENPGFIPLQSGYKNLEYLASIKNTIGKDEIIQAIETVGLNPLDKKMVAKYSLGMRQRLGIAQAIMENPDLLILDEPMNGLDNDGVAQMRELFLKLKEDGKTILLISHNREDIAVLCDTSIELDKGCIINRK